jgi:hypothetical protein
MLRRDFLKLLGFASAGTVVAMAIPVAAWSAASPMVRAGGLLYRSDGTGKIAVSADEGTTWALHSDLGDDYSVSRLIVYGTDRLHAMVDYGAWNFDLKLAPDLRSWLTT